MANYSGWKTNQTTPAGIDSGAWLIFCGQNAAPNLFYADGRSVGLSTAKGGLGGVELAINGQSCCGSDWAAMEISIWQRPLSQAELLAVSNYYSSILNGTFSQNGVYSCTSCAAGEYSTGFGEQNCLLCPAGNYSSADGATSCSHCDVGTYSSIAGVSTSELCLLCTAGTFVGSQGASSCLACSAGTYGTSLGATGAGNCVNCSLGSYSSATGAASIQTCSLCVAGTFSTNFGAVSSNICSSCAAGTFSTALGTGICSQCPAGFYSTSLGAIAQSTCVTCAAGSYLSTLGGSAASDCTLCFTGAYSLGRGRTSASFCSLCGAGTYQPKLGQSTESACTLCGPGTYSTGIGMSTPDSCTGCGVGTYSTARGLQSTCATCGAGTYITATSATACATCSSCPIGEFESSPCIFSADIACLPLQVQAPIILKYFAAFGQLPLAMLVTVYVLYTALFFGRPLFPFPEFVKFWWGKTVEAYSIFRNISGKDWARMPITIVCWPFAATESEENENLVIEATWSILKGAYDFISDLLFLTVLEPSNPYGHFWIVFAGLSASVLTSCLLSMLYNEPVLLYITSSSQYFHSGYSSATAANLNRVQILLFETGPVMFVQIWLLLILFGATTSQYSWIDWTILIQSQAFTLFNMTKNVFFLRRKLFGKDTSLRSEMRRRSAHIVRKGSALVHQIRKLSQSSQKSAEAERRPSIENDPSNFSAACQVVYQHDKITKSKFEYFEDDSS